MSEVKTYIICSGQTDTGRRAANDDCIFSDEAHGVFVVCDGASARIGGRTAAELACEAVRREVAQRLGQLGDTIRPETETIVGEIMEIAHQDIVRAQQADVQLEGMTTTITLVLHRQGSVHIAHVGDSRVYLSRAGELRQLTRDHSLENYLKDNPHVRSKIKRPGKTLVRALGLKTSKLGTEHRQLALETGDLLFLCTDGVTDSVPSWVLRAILAGVKTIPGKEVVGGLVRAALSHGSMDNISAMLLQVTDKPAAESHTAIYDMSSAGRAATTMVLGWFTFLEGARKGEVIPLSASTVIGADDDCAVTIQENFVSGRHAEVFRTEDGFVLRDLGSTNGTYLNDVKADEVALVDGDLVRVGSTPIVFKSVEVDIDKWQDARQLSQ